MDGFVKMVKTKVKSEGYKKTYKSAIFILVNHPDIESYSVIKASKDKKKLHKYAKDFGYPLDRKDFMFNFNKIIEVETI